MLLLLCKLIITAHKLLCFTGDYCIAAVVCKHLNMDGPRWEVQKEYVAECIRAKRANCGTSMKREYFGKVFKFAVCFLLSVTNSFMIFG